MVEAADAMGLGKLYLAKIAELRAVTDLIFGLAHVAGGYGSGFENPISIKLPKVGLPSLARTNSNDYVIAENGRDDVWRGLAQSLLLDPFHAAEKAIPLPK